MQISKLSLCIVVTLSFLASCVKKNPVEKLEPIEDPSTYKEYASIKLGGEASAEIAAYDQLTKRLFVVNNGAGAMVDVIDVSGFPVVTKTQSLNFSTVSGAANSVAVRDGLLAIALEAINKQDNGKIVIINTNTLQEIKQVNVGALPDMVTFTTDGKYILSANEGEPNDAYTNDPVGSVSIIDIKNGYAVKTLDFSAFENSMASLVAGGFRIFGKNASLAKDVEPEYITVSPDSKMAWVTLQENNAVAEIDIINGKILKIQPLGVKDISLAGNPFDVSDRDNKIALQNWPIKAFYLPDAISYFSTNGNTYLALANEGDTRAYAGFNEEKRVKDLKLDLGRFPNASLLQQDANLGRLTVTSSKGDTDQDGDYDELYATGARSVSFVNIATGQTISEIGKDLEQRVIAAGKYDDTRSDNKGVEVEGVVVASVSNKLLAFIGMERANMIAIYEVSDPLNPVFVQLFETGNAPEGLLLIPAKESPNGKSMIVVSSEGDGTVRFYQTEK